MAKRTSQIRKPEKCCCFHHFRGEAPPWPCSAGDEAAPRCVPADLALLRSHLRDQVASIPRAAASAALQPHLSRMFLTVWVGLAQVSRALAEQCHASNLRGHCKSHPMHCFIPTHTRTFAGERAPLIRCTASSIVDMGQLAGLRHAAPPAMPPRPSRARSHPLKKTNPCSTRVAGAIPCSLAAHASIVSRPAHFSHLDSRVRTLFRRSLRPLRFTYGAQRPSWTSSSSPKVGALPLPRQRAALRHSPRACPASGAL